MPKVYIETYGCTENKNESEIMMGILKESGFEIIRDEKDADLIIVNTCYVKFPTEQKIIFRLNQIRKNYPEKKLIISGCMPEKMNFHLRKIVPHASFVSTHHITEISRAAEKVLEGKQIEMTGSSEKIKLCLPKIRSDNNIDIVPISSGCNSACSYCCVRLAKGKLFSYPEEKILEQVKDAVKSGCKEIWITSQDNSAYGMDGMKERLPDIINSITDIRGDFFVKIGMMNPRNVLPILDDLVIAYKNEKVYKFLHLPIQTGSNKILKDMRRGYTVEDFETIVKKFKKEHRVQIWTDVIVGYPTETKEQFTETLNLIKKIKPSWVNVSKYGHRPGTEASKLEELDKEILKERSKILSEKVRKISLEKKKEWIGWEGKILINKRGKLKSQWLGRNTSYEPVAVISKENLSGKFIDVDIENAMISCLFGKII